MKYEFGRCQAFLRNESFSFPVFNGFSFPPHRFNLNLITVIALNVEQGRRSRSTVVFASVCHPPRGTLLPLSPEEEPSSLYPSHRPPSPHPRFTTLPRVSFRSPSTVQRHVHRCDLLPPTSSPSGSDFPSPSSSGFGPSCLAPPASFPVPTPSSWTPMTSPRPSAAPPRGPPLIFRSPPTLCHHPSPTRTSRVARSPFARDCSRWPSPSTLLAPPCL